MDSLLNTSRPPVFCPGCAHERVVRELDRTFALLGLKGEEIVIVTDIGCSGLFDTFFNTHAFHGLHGRALTYATGIKMARPELKVVVTMGDGGLGIGGAHVLSTCRRNIDLTLLVLNNFNYGMTGGQCSATTPPDASVSSGFLNRLEAPLDICQVAGAAGATYLARVSAYRKDLAEEMEKAIRHKGFSLVDVWGGCPGRYTRRNKLTPQSIADALSALPPVDDFMARNARSEYGEHYRTEAAGLQAFASPPVASKQFDAGATGRLETVILGSAGQRIVTAGEILCRAGISAGLNATQKNDYPITVLRGHSVSELILSDSEIGYTGISIPDAVIALAAEGVARRKAMFGRLSDQSWVVRAQDVDIPETGARVASLDFKSGKFKSADWAMAALAFLARQGRILTPEMLNAALASRFRGAVLEETRALVARAMQELPAA